jgi:hypothetical protein
MATISVGTVHVDAPLSNLARLYRPLDSGFVAEEIAPRLPVAHETDLFYVFDQGSFYGTEVSDLVADRTPPREVDTSVSTSSYACQRRELAWTISTRERNNADNQLRLDVNKQLLTLGRLQLLREARIVAILSDSSITTTLPNGEKFTGGINSGMTAAAGAKWDSATTTWLTISTDITKGITKMRQSIGVRPNTLVIPAGVAEGLNKSIAFSAAGGPLNMYTGQPDNNPYFQEFPLLPSRIMGCRVLVAGMISNTAKEGQAASFSDVWGEQVLLAYVTDGPAIDTPSLAYTFTAEPRQTRASRDEVRRLDWRAVGETIDERVVAPFAGYTISDCLT